MFLSTTLASQGHVTTCAVCTIVNTAVADDNSVWPWPRAVHASRLQPGQAGSVR